MTGATLACALAKAGLRVAVIEASDPPPPPGDERQLRVSAISRASERVLRAIDVWDALPLERAGVFREMRVWDATGSGSVHFDSADIGSDALGHVVENDVIQRGLNTRMGSLDTLKLHRPEELQDMQVEKSRVTLRLGGTRLHARLVVAADGSRSRVRELAGIQCDVGDYGQQAVVATVRTELWHRETAWQRFLPDGPLAFLPLPGNLCSIVWSTLPEHAQALLTATDESFAAAVEEAFESRLGGLEAVAGRGVFPLRHLHARAYIADRVALVGDAAHTVHPLAGQGANLGLQDAAALAEILYANWSRDRDLGRRMNLRPYERWRKGRNLLMQRGMSGFQWLFGSRLEPVRVARNLGLSMVDGSPPLKRMFMRYASGYGGERPRMAQARPWPE
ncbi:MAG: ubiquinone biosynthesis protein UbiH [Proteobacteria bacterium]|nr:ubiquinone biosynthesis protein UbiH [Pseudomonadota bacterium]